MKKLYAFLFTLGLLFAGCSSDDFVPTPTPEPEPVNYTSGNADFSNYVAVGNSLTAGFSDAALFIDGQTASFPNMLAGNFALAGGGSFTIPFMADNLGGATLGGTPFFGNRLILDFSTGSPIPTPVEGQGSTEISSTLNGPFNNMGVPGAKSYHLLAPGYGNVAGVAAGLANPYFARFASSPNTTVLGDAASQNPTFFTLWIGNNDVLGFATSGGAGVDQTGNIDPSTYGSSDISDPMVVAGSIDAVLQTLTANGADGAIANIPDVTSIPYFSVVPYNSIPLDEATATLLNGAFAAYNGGVAQLQGLGVLSEEEADRRMVSYSAGANNPVLLLDEDLTDLTGFNPALTNMRPATADDLIIFPAATFLGTTVGGNPTLINGVSVPLADNWVLTPEEQLAANTAVTAYNQVIAALAAQYDLALVDANAYLTGIVESGVTLNDGSVVTADFGTGGGFSLDGVHPSPRGYALLANLFIEAINAKYGSNLPGVDPLDFTGLYIN